MIRSLRFRLAIGAVIAIGITLMLIWVALSKAFTEYVVQQYRTEMTVLSDSLTASVAVKDGRLVLAAAPSDPRLNLPGGGRYWELEEDDKVLDRSRSLWDTVIEEAKLLPSAYAPFQTAVGPSGETMLVLAQESTLGEGKDARHFCIYTAFPLSELEAALTGFHDQLRFMLAVTAGLLALAAFVQVATGLAPLGRLRAKVADIRNGRLSRMVDEGPSEVQPLVHEIDLLLEERETAVERARSRASDLAHGLKTPLTVLSQLVERMTPEDAEMALKQIDIIRRRADRQLQAARLGAERMATADIGELTTKLVQVLKPITAEKGLRWHVRAQGDLHVEADPADLAEAIGNVLDNAVKWARTEIRVDAFRTKDKVSIRIADDGPGIPDGDRHAALDRGTHAGGDEGGGSGLGLAITADIMRAYDASLELSRAAAGGLETVMHFPTKGAKRAAVV
ncbi:MAG: putative sensory transduction histidine kinase [Rhizobium sp.]|nr:putative sensory transduction histidine kinase [Rhizobium sp.]